MMTNILNIGHKENKDNTSSGKMPYKESHTLNGKLLFTLISISSGVLL